MIERYDRLMQGVRELMIRKNHDYGEAWRDMRLTSITDQILVKAYRILQLKKKDPRTLSSEGIESELYDIINYCVFALIKVAEAREEGRG